MRGSLSSANLPGFSQMPSGPDAFETALERLHCKLLERENPQSAIDAVFSELEKLSPLAFSGAMRKISVAVSLHEEPRHGFSALVGCFVRQMSTQQMIERWPNLAYLSTFDYNGRIREAALNSINAPPSSAFLFMAIAYRLNDWVIEVRRAARACAERIFPLTDPSIVAAAAVVLIERRTMWNRWGDESSVLEAALDREDVCRHLVEIIATRTYGSMARLLRFALRRNTLDRYLLDLSQNAVQPAVRAVALQSLINSRACWPTGFRQQWIDKSMGISKRVVTFGERDLVRPASIESLIELGKRDRAALVRKVAVDGLVKYRRVTPNALALAKRFAEDSNKSVRERGAFALSALTVET
ncbi:MAG: hypothetical protein ACRED5_07385 [Propylenella sp.]